VIDAEARKRNTQRPIVFDEVVDMVEYWCAAHVWDETSVFEESFGFEQRVFIPRVEMEARGFARAQR